MSMWLSYVRERLGHEAIETKHGFATYKFIDEKTVYLVDLYVLPDFRHLGVARDLGDAVMEIGKKHGCTKMIGSVVPSAFGSADSMRVLLAYGMVPESSGNDYIIFKREIV